MHPKAVFHRGSTLLLAGVLTSLLVVFPVAAAASNITVDCTGATPGALTSLQAAIDSSDLVGPNQIDVVGGPCTENIVIQDRQRLTITASPIGVFILSAVGADDNVMRILGSTGITLVQLGFSNGANGLVIRRNSEVSVVGCTISGNAAAAPQVIENVQSQEISATSARSATLLVVAMKNRELTEAGCCKLPSSIQPILQSSTVWVGWSLETKPMC